jgi:hypothetical protein
LAEFEGLSGLKSNPAKSSLFVAGLTWPEKSVLHEFMQVPEGSLPVRYLGVPLITGLFKHLSFAGRLQLISSVLFSLQVYWAQVFILPKVIGLLEHKLNTFLWCGQDTKAKAKVAWEKVCVPKKEGGLGLRRLEVWNKAAMLNHIWNLFARAGSLWVAWVEMTWLKGRSFWQVSAPHPCPWSWRKMLKLREIAKQFIHFKIGDGSKVFLWFDNWHLDVCLIDTYGFWAVYDAGSQLEAKVSSIICNGDWFWSGARSESIVATQCRLSEVKIGGTDMPVVFSCYETWDLLRERRPIVSWWKTAWFSKAIPRHSFLLWLTFRDALPPKDRMCQWYGGNSLCPFCYRRRE